MAFSIPRIQYKNIDISGATHSGTAVIDGLADTSDIVVGMFVRGTGVPTGKTVLSKTSTSVTLSSGTCSASATVTISFGYEILFDYPPIEPKGEELNTKASVSESLSGITQVSVNYTEGLRDLKFSFLSPAIYALVSTFLTSSAILGETFRYYEDQTSSTYVEYELNELKVTPKKIAPRSATTYSWEVPLRFRRVL